jgi:hypothetical protein
MSGIERTMVGGANGFRPWRTVWLNSYSSTGFSRREANLDLMKDWPKIWLMEGRRSGFFVSICSTSALKSLLY